jgi:hypothetical protein
VAASAAGWDLAVNLDNWSGRDASQLRDPLLGDCRAQVALDLAPPTVAAHLESLLESARCCRLALGHIADLVIM